MYITNRDSVIYKVSRMLNNFMAVKTDCTRSKQIIYVTPLPSSFSMMETVTKKGQVLENVKKH